MKNFLNKLVNLYDTTGSGRVIIPFNSYPFPITSFLGYTTQLSTGMSTAYSPDVFFNFIFINVNPQRTLSS